ncbi:MAG: hypothetical protein EON91_06840 [Brevundimonas sp.]|uniref:type II secretion system protein GspM n=1 Tax=Brevundimonas sp. TaxID=1871086 RepID=UPI00122338BE|nr:type II secretion system protein GspM [Brevundimonas sp.]RZJ18045.1 MAG: hypothetical protein EON91_06840 [Brevundimonas sp.]
MNVIINPLIETWRGRTMRERRMLGGLGLLLALFAVWYGVIAPALSWRGDAADRLGSARTRAAAVHDGLARLKGQAPGAVLPLGDVEAIVRQTAQEAGVVVTTQVEGDTLGFSVESATSAGLFGWLQTLEGQHGVTATALNIAENADATLQAQGALRGVRPS